MFGNRPPHRSEPVTWTGACAYSTPVSLCPGACRALDGALRGSFRSRTPPSSSFPLAEGHHRARRSGRPAVREPFRACVRTQSPGASAPPEPLPWWSPPFPFAIRGRTNATQSSGRASTCCRARARSCGSPVRGCRPSRVAIDGVKWTRNGQVENVPFAGRRKVCTKALGREEDANSMISRRRCIEEGLAFKPAAKQHVRTVVGTVNGSGSRCSTFHLRAGGGSGGHGAPPSLPHRFPPTHVHRQRPDRI